MFNDNDNGVDQPQIDIPLPVAKDESKQAQSTQSNVCLNVEPRSGRRSRNVRILHPAQSDSEGRSRPREGGTTAKSDDKSRPRISTHASSKSAPGATKPMTGLDAGIVAATDSTLNDASRIQMVQGGEGGAVDDVEQGASGSPTPQPALTLPSSMAHEPRMAAPRSGWPMFAPMMQPVDHQIGMMAAPTAEGVHQNGDASSKSAPGATKPMTGLVIGLVQMVQGGEGGAVDDVEQSHEEASNMAQLDVGPNRTHVVRERINRVLNPNAASFIPRARSKIHATVLNPNAASFIPGAKNSGVGASGSPTPQPALTLPSSMAHEPRMAAPGLALPMFAPRMQPLDHRDGMMAAPTAEGVPQYGAIPPNVQDAQHQMQMWQQQGAAARHQHQLQQQQMLARQQYMARPENSFEQQRQRETARNASQGHIRGHKELVDGEEDEEYPCVICHDEMSGDNTLEIECGHIFHIHCLHEWLKRRGTCPMCRYRTNLLFAAQVRER